MSEYIIHFTYKCTCVDFQKEKCQTVQNVYIIHYTCTCVDFQKEKCQDS